MFFVCSFEKFLRSIDTYWNAELKIEIYRLVKGRVVAIELDLDEVVIISTTPSDIVPYNPSMKSTHVDKQ